MTYKKAVLQRLRLFFFLVNYVTATLNESFKKKEIDHYSVIYLFRCFGLILLIAVIQINKKERSPLNSTRALRSYSLVWTIPIKGWLLLVYHTDLDR